MRVLYLYVAIIFFFLNGCVSYSTYFKLDEEYIQRRQLETKFFETDNENVALTSVTQTLQDSGFILQETNEHLGLITAFKDREAGSTAAKVGIIILSALAGTQPVYEVSQRIYVTVVTTRNNNGYNIRTAFARMVFLSNGNIGIETIKDHEVYSHFFEKLSQSLFLTAHDL
ncbi:MAG: hypothetical protein IJD28_08150 [Deferribacterales bacterium]|nr:hypothetical protein [Deferribacterales bacterium]